MTQWLADVWVSVSNTISYRLCPRKVNRRHWDDIDWQALVATDDDEAERNRQWQYLCEDWRRHMIDEKPAVHKQ